MSEKVEIENVNTPGRTTRVDRAKYDAMRAALLRVLPDGEPGLTAAAATVAATEHLPDDLFPGGKAAGWWQKTVQLDLEAKGLVVRLPTKPLTFRRA